MIPGLFRKSLPFLIGAIFTTACSVVPKNQSELSGLRELAEWKASLPAAKAAGASQPKYEQARLKVNSLISPTLESKVDSVARQSLFGIGGTVDMTKEKILDPSTTSVVNEFFASKSSFGSLGADDVVSGIVKGLLEWAEEAAREARQASATELKSKLLGYQWPAWEKID